jgi:hypothetical protein
VRKKLGEKETKRGINNKKRRQRGKDTRRNRDKERKQQGGKHTK